MLVTGCTVTSTAVPTGGDGGGGGGAGSGSDGGASGVDGGDAAAVGSSALSCAAVLDCISKCPTNDDACDNACVAKGSKPSQDAVLQLAACSQTNACADSACLEGKCATELQACLQSASSGTPIDGGAPASGSVPAELVGKWYSYGVLYEFVADGKTTRASSVTTGTCTSEALEQGTAVVSGTTLKIYFTTGAFKICGSPSTQPYTQSVEPFTYSIDTNGTILRLAKQNCTYTDPASIGLYCTDGYDKQ